MRVTFHGVRGSTPSPGAEFVRYGGSTSCVAVGLGDGPPTLALDAGTGLRSLARSLAGEPFVGTILLGHLHWDHTHGLPFFPAGVREDASVRVLLPAQGGMEAEELLARAMSPPSFPVRPSELLGDWRFGTLEPGEFAAEGFAVTALEIPHKGGRTYGYRVVAPSGASLAYLSDHSPTSAGPGPSGLGAYHDTALALADGVDLLIHDSQYTAAELPRWIHYGHAAMEYAVGLAAEARARHLMLFHHDPARTDDALDALAAPLAASAPLPVTAAAEGMVVDL